MPLTKIYYQPVFFFNNNKLKSLSSIKELTLSIHAVYEHCHQGLNYIDKDSNIINIY